MAALFISAPAVFADAAKAQPASQVIHRAQDLALHHRRKEALLLLQENLNQTSGKDRDTLRDALGELANRFISDKGQRSFELGQSLLPMQTSQALHHFRESEKLEDGNLQVSLGVVRAFLAADDCRSAEKTLEPLETLMPVSQVLQEIALEVAWCREDQNRVETLIKAAPADQKLTPAIIKTGSAWVKWMASEPVKASAQIKEALALDAQNPGALYWLWRIEKDSEKEPEAAAVPAAEAYLLRCRGKEKEIRRRKASLIEMCLHVAEVDAYLKSRAAESGNGG